MKYILTKKAMLRLGDILVLKYKERIEADQTIATGKLKDSFKYKLTGLNTNVIGLEILAAKYAKVIDEGRKAGKRRPGINSIIAWMKAKGITPNRGTKLKDYKEAASSIAKFIAEKGTIKRFGYKGTNYLKIVAQQYGEPGVLQILEAYEKDVKNELDKAIKTQ
jgi:hypothetical protein